MIGAIIGDIAGSRFEWHNIKDKEFELFTSRCRPTDDSVMTLAVADAILACDGDTEKLPDAAIKSMQLLGRRYPNAGYGGSFRRWLVAEHPHPYQSWGNGAAMRVSPCGFAAKTLDGAVAFSRAVTQVTHDHEESFRAAAAVSSAIFMAREGSSLDGIKAYINENYYQTDFTLDAIRPTYEFDVSCQGSVPQAFEAFFESTGFEDAIRNAISIGGDSDTIAAITGGMAEAYYGVPEDIRVQALMFLDDTQKDILARFEEKYGIR